MLIRDLGEGLILRHATPADAEPLAAFNADVHRDFGAPDPDPYILHWTRDLLTRPHPTFKPSDFTVVQNTHTGAIVSSLNLISQTWSYAGIPFGVGRVELVGTAPEYRRRGLVRCQFEVVHGWSAERGELAQGITGIPWYYRQFGYEYAISLDAGRMAQRSALPNPSASDAGADRWRVRPATPDDVPFIVEIDEHARRRSLVSCVRDTALWRHELDGPSEDSPARLVLSIVERATGERAGFVAHDRLLRGPNVVVRDLELAQDVSWLAALPGVLRYLRGAGEEYERRPGAQRFENVSFMLGEDHPLYRAMPNRLPGVIPAYAWYIRVPDVPAFLNQVGPVLEARLAGSEAAGHTGELRLNLYRDGVRLSFADGKLRAERWPEAHHDLAGASFPDLTFLTLLFGHRSLDELEFAFPDCRTHKEEVRALLTILFPKQASFVRGVD